MAGRSRTRGVRMTYVGVRLPDEDIKNVEDRARGEGLVKNDGEPNRSEMVRIMVAYAAAHMPAGWREAGEV